MGQAGNQLHLYVPVQNTVQLLIAFISRYSSLSSRLIASLVAECSFYGTFLKIHRSDVLTAFFGCFMAGATKLPLFQRVLCTPFNHEPYHVTS